MVIKMLQYPWQPYNSSYIDISNYINLFSSGIEISKNIDEVVSSACAYMIDNHLRHQINDTIHLSIQNALRHALRHPDDLSRETKALARDRIPSSAQDDKTLQFLIAFMYEKDIAFDQFVNSVKETIYYARSLYGVGPLKYYATDPSDSLDKFLNECSENASEVVEVLAISRSKIGNFAEKSDFIRDWALINLGKKTGLEITANGNPFEVGLDGDNREYSELLANQSIKKERLQGLRVVTLHRRSTVADDVTITAKNGPSQIRIKTSSTVWGSPFVLAKDASRTITKAEMAYDIESTPILLPVAKRELPDIADLDVGVVESVNLADLFDGIRIAITATSADTDKVTVSVNSSQNSMGVTGVAVGTSKITVTGTNEAGATTVDFDVTVTSTD